MIAAPELKIIFEKKYDRKSWYRVLNENFNVKDLNENPIDITSRIKANSYNAKALELGTFVTQGEGHLIGLYEIEVADNVKIHRNRKGLKELLSKIYRDDVEAALLVFVQGDKWRFSYVSEITVKNKLTKKREKKTTDSKRFTYLLGSGERTKTAADRFARIQRSEDLFGGGVSLDALEEAFNVDKMSKAFFNEYRKQYGYFTAHITGEDENGKKIRSTSPFLSTTFNGDHKTARDFIKKMMGRIVFLYFLEKKGWLGVPADKNWGDGDEFFLSNLFKHSKDKKAFYSNVLAPLFFATLNTERKDDYFKIDDTLFTQPGYSKLKIPYLNGGLFEEDEIMKQFLVFPEELFSNLFNFFDQYNFTVYEDSPDEHTVAVDPEMLGHIFENLLEDNKDKGAFYTPKEIVHYMCRESLIEYLYTKLNPQSPESYQEHGKPQVEIFGNTAKKGQLSPEQKHNDPTELVPRAAIEKFVLHHEGGDIIEFEETILKALKDVKICDPAIGSGAFPMGLLIEIFYLVEALYFVSPDVTGKIWKLGKKWNPAKVKEQIIQNSIYGVDIEKGAVDIARLRFWLSLVVDEDIPKPLPNLDYKIVVGNSLLSKYENEVIDIDWKIKNKNASAVESIINDQQTKLVLLSTRQHEYFQAGVDKGKQQLRIRDLKIDILRNQLTLTRIAFEENNKVQLGLHSNDKELEQAQVITEKIRDYNRAIHKLESLKKIREESLDYFDWKLDFPEVMNEKLIKGQIGFDIVIANPPYGADVDHDKLNIDYTLSKKRLSNTYSYFMEKSLKLTKDYGNITLIVPNTWLSITSTRVLREVFFVENTIKQLLFTHQIFESMADIPPVVDTVVFTCLLQKNKSENVSLITLKDDASIRERLLEVESRSWSNIKTTKVLETNEFKIQLKENFFHWNTNFFLLEEKKDPKYIVRIGTQEYAVGKGNPPLKKEQIKQRIYHSKEKIDSSYLPFVPCGDIQSFHFRWSKTYLKWGDNLHCPREEEIYSKEHILVSRIFDKKNKKLKACHIPAGEKNYFFINNTDSFNVVPNSDPPFHSLKFLLGLISSKFIGYYLTTSNVNLIRSVYPKINTNDLKKIPIVSNVSEKVCRVIESLIDEISNKRALDLKADVSLLENENDLIVYKLYNLDYKEAHIIEDKKEWITKEDYDRFTIE